VFCCLFSAYTGSEDTNYQFQVIVPRDLLPEESPLREALSRFSQFFIAPLFTESATERELNAVDSEHQKNVQSDNWRLNQLQRSAASPLHPHSKFGTGSKATLWDNAKEKGIDTRAALMDFHSKFYSANAMTLAVAGPHDLDLMTEWVVNMFSQVENKNVQHPSTSYSDHLPLRDEEDVRRIFRIVPIKDSRNLELSWLIPSTRAQFHSKPAGYLSHLLGHEGKGSLLSLMKERNWAEGLIAGPNSITGQFGFFEVFIEMTKEGLDHVDELVALVFSYIRLVKEDGIREWIHNESSSLSDIAFRFAERGEPFSVVQQLSASMPHFPEADYLSGSILCTEYDPSAVRKILACLVPSRVNVFIVSKTFQGSTDREEHWYGTSYRMDEVSAEQLASWENCKVDAGLAVPAENPFIPTDFTLAAEPLPAGDDDLAGPVKIAETDAYELHFKLDRTFRRPRASICVKFEMLPAYSSAKDAVLTDLFVSLLEDSLIDEVAYNAELAGLRYSLSPMSYGVHLSVGGYTDKLHVLVNAIVDKLTSLEIRADRFDMVRDQTERRWANFAMAQPYRHAMYNYTKLVDIPRWHINDLLSIIRDGSITANSVRDFVPKLLKQVYSTFLVHGSVSESWVRNRCELHS
jgi:insulysin